MNVYQGKESMLCNIPDEVWSGMSGEEMSLAIEAEDMYLRRCRISAYKDSPKRCYKAQVICQHCSRSFDKNGYNQWHGDKCKDRLLNTWG